MLKKLTSKVFLKKNLEMSKNSYKIRDRVGLSSEKDFKSSCCLT